MISDGHQNVSREKSVEPHFSRENPIVTSLPRAAQGFFSIFEVFVGSFVFRGSRCFWVLDSGYATLVSQTLHDT